MKRQLIPSVMVLLALPPFAVVAQENCKVLLPQIADSYTGTCKNGLADGKGEAFGTDQYNGEFKKGLPEGKGVYIWQAGDKYDGSWKKGLREGQGIYTFKSEGRDTVISGIWKEDRYIGTTEVKPYQITYRSGIARASIMKSGDVPGYVVYKFSRAGGSVDDINELMMQGTTGDEMITSNFTGFEQVKFPFEGKIKFTAPNALRTSMIRCEMHYKINEPGAWTVTIYY
ncbi:MAG: hypothetical protein U5L72_14175 [Bacteroidales bacterium]|nr:hypothetical protein [Bacteroidales bacterium]